MVEVTEQNFSELTQSAQPVVVEFGAEWCGSCQELSATMAEVEKEFADKVVIGVADADECPDINAQYGIRGLPVVLYFKGGELRDKSVGSVKKQELMDKINALL
mgnify:CR=1 FL=1